MKRIEITVKPDGTMEVKAQGYKGKSCEEATRKIIAALGEENQHTRSAEYYLPEIEQERVKNG